MKFLGVLAVTLSLVPISQALADTRDDVEAGIVRCRNVTDDRRWLDCIYGAAQPMREKLGLPSAPQARMTFFTSQAPSNTQLSPLRSNSPTNRGQSFGLPSPEQANSQSARVNRVDAVMVSYAFDRSGIFTVTLANGQVWRQQSGDTSLAHWNKPAGSYMVHVTRGALGSYNLSVDGAAEGYKVKRLQ